MSKNILIVLVAVLLLAAAAFFFMNRNSITPALTGEEGTGTERGETPSYTEQTGDRGVRSFIELVGLGGSMTCTFSTDATDSEYPINGVMYTDGGKIRIDSTSIIDNEESEFSMISDDAYTYTWGTSDGETYAMKMARVDMTEQGYEQDGDSEYSTPAGDEQFDYGQDVEYDCSHGRIDQDLFTPPSNIEFIDYEAMQSGAFDEETMRQMMEQYGNE